MLRKLVVLMALAFGLALLTVGCSDSDKTINSLPIVVDDGSEIHDPPTDVDYVVTDTLIDYRDEIRQLAPWFLDSTDVVLYRLSSDPRQAVSLEAILAVTGWDWKVTKAIDGNAVSDWAWLTDPADGLVAYNTIKAWYGKYMSCWFTKADPTYLYDYWIQYGYSYKPVSAYSQVSSYACYGGIGRGLECPSFVNAILWRSSFYQKKLPSYSASYSDYTGARTYTKPYTKALVGDLVRSKATNGHIGIIVRIMAGTPGSSVTSVDVVDANYVGGAGNEIIGRHIISISGTGIGLGDLKNYYVIDLTALIAL